LSTTSYHRWKVLMTKEFFELRKKIAQHRHSDIDTYGSKDPSEFFAVTVEDFFERSVVFNNKHPELFSLYQDYFKINPLKWH
jgi:Mlc titration factor MtfA (ptsG expression regulator)